MTGKGFQLSVFFKAAIKIALYGMQFAIGVPWSIMVDQNHKTNSCKKAQRAHFHAMLNLSLKALPEFHSLYKRDAQKHTKEKCSLSKGIWGERVRNLNKKVSKIGSSWLTKHVGDTKWTWKNIKKKIYRYIYISNKHVKLFYFLTQPGPDRVKIVECVGSCRPLSSCRKPGQFQFVECEPIIFLISRASWCKQGMHQSQLWVTRGRHADSLNGR